MNKRFGKTLLKGYFVATTATMQPFRRLLLSLVWHFEGPPRILGPVIVRSFGGDVRIGRNVMFGPTVTIGCATGGTLRIGSGTGINQGSFIEAQELVDIGHNVMIGEYVGIRDNDHRFDEADAPICDQGYVTAPVIIEDDVWIGRCAVVTKGVRIGEGAVIGANSVVTHDIPAGAVAAGVPARVLRWRKPLENQRVEDRLAAG